MNDFNLIVELSSVTVQQRAKNPTNNEATKCLKCTEPHQEHGGK